MEAELRNAVAGRKRRRLERHYCKMSPSEAKMVRDSCIHVHTCTYTACICSIHVTGRSLVGF